MRGSSALAPVLAGFLLLAGCGGGGPSGGGAAGGKAAAVAIVPGGPHRYFEPMRQAIVDAAADFHHPRHA